MQAKNARSRGVTLTINRYASLVQTVGDHVEGDASGVQH